MTPQSFATRFSFFNALVFISSGVQLPFLPLWLSAKGLNFSQIAAVLAVMMASRLVATPLAAFLADKYQNRRNIIIGCNIVAFFAYATLYFMSSFATIFVMCIVAALAFAPVFPLVESFSVDGSAAHGLDYGRIRLWASLSFLTGSLGGGLLLPFLQTDAAVGIMACAQLVAAGVSFLLPVDLGQSSHLKEDHVAHSVSAVWKLIAKPGFAIFLAAACLAQSSHGFLYTFASVNWHAQSYNETDIGIFWTVGVIAEVSLFAFSNIVVNRFGPVLLICMGTSGAILRWVLMAHEMPFYATASVQVLHAVSFAMTHLGTMHYMRLTVPPSLRNTTQGLYSAISGGVFMAAVAWSSGPLYVNLGSKAYYAMAGISLLSFGFALVLLRLNPRALRVLAS
jgi:MFS transporter, PPP family, 3-phenylpropionic acid transporter